MNLIIDEGNTFVKIFLYKNNTQQKFNRTKNFCVDFLTNFIARNEISNIIISSVKNFDSEIMNFLNSLCKNIFFLNSNTHLPITNLYKTKDTLGYDRIASSVGANYLFPNTNILIVDIGTAITYDIINKNNEYIGGDISLGLNIRFNALNTFTEKLPRCEPTFKKEIIANNTNNAIINGVQNGILFEIEGYINELSKEFNELKIIFTGGDCNFFVKYIKKPIFAEANLIAVGLNQILLYNVKNK